MEIRPIADGYAVSPQIAPDDVPEIQAAGYTTVVCNRPDGEVPHELHAAIIRAAVEAAGLRFVVNPVVGGAITMENVQAQGAALAGADGPVLAYCASGNRSSIVWALSQAGKRPTDELIAAGARYGYATEQFRATIEKLAER